MLTKYRCTGTALLMAVSLTTVAQSKKASAPKPATPPRDPAIVAALHEISAARIQATIEKLAGFGNRSTLSVEQPAASGKGIAAARDWIKSELERYSKDCNGCLEVSTDTFIEQPADRIPKPTEITNVYAVLRGSDAEQAKRIYLVSGHYDSRNSDTFNATDPAPGANDDASGVAVSLECARVLSKRKFPATLIFMAVAGEEQGLNGSKHFAQMAKQKGWNVDGVFNNDIVGGNRTPGDKLQRWDVVRVFSEGLATAATSKELGLLRSLGGENDSTSRQLARYISDTARTYLPAAFQPLLIFRRDRYLRGGDHISFNEQGYAAVRFTEFREDYHHQHQNVRTENGIEYGDLPKFVNYDYVANVARANAAAMAALASAPSPPQNVRLLTKQLENDSSLAWDAPAGSEASFEVLWRSTTAPDWEHAQSAGKQTRLKLPMSKDNVIFAVRAVDTKGHRSLAIVPLPER